MKIPFSLPVIDKPVIDEMNDTLTRTGWLTSGPKVRAFEEKLGEFIGNPYTLCVNSWTSGAMLALRWYDVGPGDEVIVPAYTYAATALCAMNMGAKVIMVDVKDDFSMDPEKMRMAVTERTKAVIPVDVGGYPADYDAIRKILCEESIRSKFHPASERQKKLGRILLLEDAAHSLGAKYRGISIGNAADITVFSFHSVKNITTGEGGAVVLNLSEKFDSDAEVSFLKILALNGQNKSAFEKNNGGWRYDILAQGLKVNMPDLCAAVGLAQLRRYRDIFLPERKRIFNYYKSRLSQFDWAVLPCDCNDEGTETSYHLFLLRIRDFKESDRDALIQKIINAGIGVNVHYIPMATLTLFRSMGYDIADYPKTKDMYQNEITLPIYNNLPQDQLRCVVDTLIHSYEELVKEKGMNSCIPV